MRKPKKNDEMQELFNEVAGIKDELAEVSELAAFLCKFDKNHIEHSVMRRCNDYFIHKNIGANVTSRFVYKNKIKEISFSVNGVVDGTVETITNNENDYIVKVGCLYFKVMKDTDVYMDVTEFFVKTKTYKIDGGSLCFEMKEREDNK